MRMLLDGRSVAGILEYCRAQCGVGLAFFERPSAEPVLASEDGEFVERCAFFPMAELLRLYRGWCVDARSAGGYLVADSSFDARHDFEAFVPLVIDAILLCRLPEGGGGPGETARRDILPRLLEASDDEAGRICASLGGRVGGGFYVMGCYVELGDPAGKSAPERLTELFERYVRILDSSPVEAIHAHTGDFFATALFCGERRKFDYLLSNVEELFSYYPASLEDGWRFFARCGIGGRGDSPACFGRSFHEARIAVRHSLMENTAEMFTPWESLGAFRLLAATPAGAQGELASALGELRMLQRAKKTPLFSTLVQLVRHYWNITATAESLSLHYNSMKYRYDRIEEVLGLDLGAERNRFELSLLVRSLVYVMEMSEFLETIS